MLKFLCGLVLGVGVMLDIHSARADLTFDDVGK